MKFSEGCTSFVLLKSRGESFQALKSHVGVPTGIRTGVFSTPYKSNLSLRYHNILSRKNSVLPKNAVWHPGLSEGVLNHGVCPSFVLLCPNLLDKQTSLKVLKISNFEFIRGGSMEDKIESFEVTILNWSKHNEGKKRGHTHILLSTRFFDDPKIAALSPQERNAFIWLLLRCGDEVRATIVATSKQMRSACGANTLRVASALRRFEELQLLRIEKINPLLYRIEGREEKRKEKNSSEVANRPSPAPVLDPPVQLIQTAKKPKSDPEVNRPTWEAYRSTYRERYKVDPTRNATVNSAVANFVKRVGEKDAPEVIEFYVHHNDNQYLKSLHDMKLALRDAEGLRTQWLKGQPITMKDVREFERKSGFQDQIDKINKGLI